MSQNHLLSPGKPLWNSVSSVVKPLNKQYRIKRQVTPGNGIPWRWMDYVFRCRLSCRQQATELRQPPAIQRTVGYYGRCFLHVLYHIHFVMDGSAAAVLAYFLRNTVICLPAFRTAGRAATLFRPASRTAIINDRNSRSAYNNKRRHQYGKYVTEPHHIRRQR